MYAIAAVEKEGSIGRSGAEFQRIWFQGFGLLRGIAFTTPFGFLGATGI